MLVSLAFIVLGLVLLVVGGDALVRGAVGLAELAKIPAAVIGLTVVAAGTSMPELAVSVQAARAGSSGMAVGNVVGSNLFNIGAILGVAALLRPLRVEGGVVRLEYPVMLLASVQLVLLARDGTVDRLEGGFLILCLVAFVAYLVWGSKVVTTEAEAAQLEQVGPATFSPSSRLRAWAVSGGLVAVGVGALVGGATALVRGASTMAIAFGVPETVVGLTVVAAGTSLPELAASVMAALRGNADIALANVIGSNIFNVLCIAGATALIQPLAVPAEILARDAWWMVGFSIVLFPLMRSGMRLSRPEGALLLGGFVAYLTLLLSA